MLETIAGCDNVFKEVHQKAQDAKEKLRRAREKLTGIRHKDAEDEAVREGFDRARLPGRKADDPQKSGESTNP
jgi:hypothetical protein